MWDYAWAAAIGALLGAAELSSRYRDAPLRALVTPAALTYIALNLFASIGCLALIHAFDVNFEIKSLDRLRVTQVLVAGFGAMAFFRSSFFVFRAGNQDVSVGPASVLQILLSALDSAVDRVRAEQRALAVAEIIKGVSFLKATDSLPMVAIALMRNLPREDSDRITNHIRLLTGTEGAQLPERAKAVALGLALMDAVGEKVLTSAVELMRSDIEEDPRLKAVEKALTEGPLLPAGGSLGVGGGVVPSPAGGEAGPSAQKAVLPPGDGEIAPPAAGALPSESGIVTPAEESGVPPPVVKNL
jgi:hypothetical protein